VLHPEPRHRDGAELDEDLLDRARESARGPKVNIVLSTAQGRDVAELRSKQLAAIVRLLRHAVEIRRAA
jgi:hypothetical protein